MRAEILHLDTTGIPQLPLQTGAPLIHARSGLVLGRRHDERAGCCREAGMRP